MHNMRVQAFYATDVPPPVPVVGHLQQSPLPAIFSDEAADMASDVGIQKTQADQSNYPIPSKDAFLCINDLFEALSA